MGIDEGHDKGSGEETGRGKCWPAHQPGSDNKDNSHNGCSDHGRIGAHEDCVSDNSDNYKPG
jgi:hypothetical protein